MFYYLCGTNLKKKIKKKRGGALKKSKCSLDVEKRFYHIVGSLQWLDKT